jgi:hypothetical protein
MRGFLVGKRSIMSSSERKNGLEPKIGLPKAGVLFDRGCFMVTPEGRDLFKPPKIESFADLAIFDCIPSERRTRRRRENWISALNSRGQ